MLAATWLVLLALAAPAHAQDADARLDAPYIAPKVMLGFGGEQEVELEVDIVTAASLDVTEDLEPTYGLGIAYMHPFLGFFAIGGQLSVASWRPITPGTVPFSAPPPEPQRDLYADLSAIPQLHLSLLSMLEVYLNVPLGLTLNFPADDVLGPELHGALAPIDDVGTGVGYHFGVLLGARVPLSNGFGLLAEVGVLLHQLQQPVEIAATRVVLPGEPPPTGRDARTLDTDVSLLQSALSAGVYF